MLTELNNSLLFFSGMVWWGREFPFGKEGPANSDNSIMSPPATVECALASPWQQ
jgi:hypothetical protein